MNKQPPKVSVITPAYNTAAFIGRAVESVLAQTYADWELLVVDDGSTDDSKQVIMSYTDARIRYLSQANQGAGAARNMGIAQSSGKYLIFLDADDWWDPQCLEFLVQALDRNPSYAIAHADWAYVDTDHKVRQIRSSAFCRGQGLKSLVLSNPIAIHSAMVRRPALLAIGGFPVEAAALEDWIMWLRLAMVGYRFLHVPEPLAFYFWRLGSRGKNIGTSKATRLATLDWLWAHGDLPEGLYALRARSYATAHVDFCVSQFSEGQVQVALQELDAAIGYEPRTASAVGTFYRIAYADANPTGSLDVEVARKRIDTTLMHLASLVLPVDIDASRHAAHYALGMAGYGRGDATFARRHFAEAVRCKPRALLNPAFSGFVVRALLPRRLTAALRQVKKTISCALSTHEICE